MENPETKALRFDRDFQIWKYDVGHSQLLLRSVKGDRHKTRVDVLFKGVQFVQLPTHFSGLRSSEMTEDEFKTLNLSTGSASANENRYFRLEGKGWKGVVIALGMFWLEEDAEYYDKSNLFSLPGDSA